MMEDNRIGDCIAVALVLVGLVLASAGVGTFGPAAAPPQLDVGQTAESVAGDGTRSAFPINNVTANVDASLSVFAFDDATLATGSVGTASDPSTLSAGPLSLDQDMDPYSLDQDMDPY